MMHLEHKFDLLNLDDQSPFVRIRVEPWNALPI
jgi:hypothetical protein